MMIEICSSEDSYKLLDLLKNENRTFGDLVSEFNSSFRPSLHFRLCSSLYLILEEKVLTAPERLVAFAILHQTYTAQPPSANPFIRFIVAAACDDCAEKFERAFILQLLGSSDSSSGKELLLLSAADYISGFDPSIHTFPEIDLLQQQYCNAPGYVQYSCLFKDCAVKNVVPDPDIPSCCKTNSSEFDLQPGTKPKLGSGDRDETIVGLLANLTLEGLGAQWIRPRPPMLPILNCELVWLIPHNNYDVLWDNGMCADSSKGAAIRDLIRKATKVTLLPAQIEKVMRELAKEPKLIHHCGVTPLRLPDIVEHNPVIACELLIRLMSSPDIADYFAALISMEMSLPCMEVVNKLTLSVKLPSDFLRLYISNCIKSCEAIKDKYMQNRLVRLVSVFLLSLIRNNHIEVKEIPIEEVQAFCINFSRVREAAGLFRLLKSTEG